MCGCRDLGEALRRIAEGAAMMRTKGEAGQGNISLKPFVTCVQSCLLSAGFKRWAIKELVALARRLALHTRARASSRKGQAAHSQFRRRRHCNARRRCVDDATRCQDHVVGSQIFGEKRRSIQERAKAIVLATTYYKDPKKLVEVSAGTTQRHAQSRCANYEGRRIAIGARMVTMVKDRAKKTVGVLALQEEFKKHKQAFGELGVAVRKVRTAQELVAFSDWLFPAGKSTTMTKLLLPEIRVPLVDFCSRRPVWGTCAGMIMLSKDASDPRVKPLGFMDLEIMSATDSAGKFIPSRRICAWIHLLKS